MRLVRFMGKYEFRKFMVGKTLYNDTEWRLCGQKTDAVGFCFFDDSQDHAERLRYAAGAVDASVCVVFDVLDENGLQDATGTYRDPDAKLFSGKTIRVSEKCCRSYSNKTMELIMLGHPVILGYKDGKGIEWSIDWVYTKGEEDAE